MKSTKNNKQIKSKRVKHIKNKKSKSRKIKSQIKKRKSTKQNKKHKLKGGVNIMDSLNKLCQMDNGDELIVAILVYFLENNVKKNLEQTDDKTFKGNISFNNNCVNLPDTISDNGLDKNTCDLLFVNMFMHMKKGYATKKETKIEFKGGFIELILSKDGFDYTVSLTPNDKSNNNDTPDDIIQHMKTIFNKPENKQIIYENFSQFAGDKLIPLMMKLIIKKMEEFEKIIEQSNNSQNNGTQAGGDGGASIIAGVAALVICGTVCVLTRKTNNKEDGYIRYYSHMTCSNALSCAEWIGRGILTVLKAVSSG